MKARCDSEIGSDMLLVGNMHSLAMPPSNVGRAIESRRQASALTGVEDRREGSPV